jgi:hypothetical protein
MAQPRCMCCAPATNSANFFAGIEHARLNRGFGNSDDPRNLPNRLLVVVDEIYDLAMLGRQSGEALAHELCPRLLLQNGVWTVRRVRNAEREVVVPFDVGPAPARGEGFIASDREEPGRDRSTRLEGGSLPPNVEEHLAQQIFRKRLFLHEAEQPPVNRDAMTCE